MVAQWLQSGGKPDGSKKGIHKPKYKDRQAKITVDNKKKAHTGRRANSITTNTLKNTKQQNMRTTNCKRATYR